MQPANDIAFKEWAAVCSALAAGRQSLILRKGGIHAGRQGFQVEHGEFWLMPTHFHQSPESLSPEAQSLLASSRTDAPPSGTVRLREYAVVDQVRRLDQWSQVERLSGLHVWSEATLRQRFDYRQPGLFALVVRVYRTSAATLLAETPYMAGCKSWVQLSEPIATAGLEPVLDEARHAEHIRAIASALGGVPSPLAGEGGDAVAG
jgi:hypothetical protein